MRHAGYSDLTTAGLRVLASGGVGRYNPIQLWEKVINRRQGVCEGSKGFVWVRAMMQPLQPDELGVDDIETMEFDYDVGAGDVYRDPDTAQFEALPKGDKRRRQLLRWNSAGYEIENSGIVDAVLQGPFDLGGEHGLSSVWDEQCDHMLRVGCLPDQMFLFETHYHGWQSYDGEYDAEFNAELIYADPAECDDELLAMIIRDRYWPVHFGRTVE